MYYATKRGYINILLLGIIVLAVVVFASWISYNAGRNVAEGLVSNTSDRITQGTEVPLIAISLAENASLQSATGLVSIDRVSGKVEADVLLADGIVLPDGSVLSVWLVDAGKLGGLGTNSVSDTDQTYGTPYANLDFSDKADSIPFARPLGTMRFSEERGTYHLFAFTQDTLDPFDAVMITLESDGNKNNYDPRPGTPILIGEVIYK